MGVTPCQTLTYPINKKAQEYIMNGEQIVNYSTRLLRQTDDLNVYMKLMIDVGYSPS